MSFSFLLFYFSSSQIFIFSDAFGFDTTPPWISGHISQPFLYIDLDSARISYIILPSCPLFILHINSQLALSVKLRYIILEEECCLTMTSVAELMLVRAGSILFL